MPVSPATFTYRLVCIVSAFNLLRRNKTLLLPIGKAVAQELKNFGFAVEIIYVRDCITAFATAVNPAYAVEAFLEDVARLGNYILIAPSP